MKKEGYVKKDIFFPYYVNQGRLLDIYAILNQGYSDYEEICQENGFGREKKVQGDVSASSGFKMLKISSNISGEKKDHQDFSDQKRTKKVQTITSILSLVLSELKEKEYLKDIKLAKEGSFVVVPVELQINSIKNILDELIEMMELISDMEKLGIDIKIRSANLSSYKRIAKSLKSFVNSEEIVSQNEEYAIIGNIAEQHYYQGTKKDIIGTKIMCLAQVKKVFPDGTDLMKDNKLGIFKDASIKNNFVNSVKSITDGDKLSFSSTAIAEIKDKPVYMIEIIALYQTENMD